MLRRFLRDERGSVSIEAVIVFPILAWVFLGVWVFFDAYRAKSINIKAAYTIGDIVSRESNEPITPAYLDGLFALQAQMNHTDEPRRIRLTAFLYDQASDRYEVRWSRTRGGAPELTDAALNTARDRLPVMPDGSWAVLTETWVGYRPDFAVGIDPIIYEDLAVTDLRFAARLCWNSVNSGGTAATEVC